MKEPVLVGTKGFTPDAERVLAQLGDVHFHSLDHAKHSLACMKGEVMLQAHTDFTTWVDSDGLFIGNCSARLPPLSTNEIHARLRSAPEMPGAFKGYNIANILERWKKDLESLGCDVREGPKPTDFRSCTSCAFSISSSSRPFLELWHRMMMTVLPAKDAGVVDRSLEFYHQLDESCLNACLTFAKNAPRIAETWRLDKDPNELFVHFIGRPKPWVAWTPRAFRHFDAVVSVVEWAKEQDLELPGAIPFPLVGSHKTWCKIMSRPNELWPKIAKRLKRITG